MSSFPYIISMGKRHLHVLLDQTPNTTKLTSLGLDKNHERASGAEVGVIVHSYLVLSRNGLIKDMPSL